MSEETTTRPAPKNKTSPEIEEKILRWQAKGVPITHIKARVEEETGETISRQTIYNILGRFGVRRTTTDARLQVLRKDALKLSRQMLRYVNGTIDTETMVSLLGEFEARWSDDG